MSFEGIGTAVPARFTVPAELHGERLDTAVSTLFGVSRTKAAERIVGGSVVVNGEMPVKSQRVLEGDTIEVADGDPDTAPETGESAPATAGPAADLRVIHDDAHLIVLDKPVGMAVHPSPGWTGPTVMGWLAAAGHTIATSGAAERQGVVHRLDVGTSGVMVVAKSERAYTLLKRAFRDREVDKIYHALVQGHPDPLRGTIDAPIDRHPVHDYRWAVVAGGKPSITHYETLEAFRYASLVEIRLETGRTHQIRVHMSAVRHPCVGDLTYGADPALSRRLGLSRQWLHAVRLSFEHPDTGERVTFESSYPEDLASALSELQESD